MSRPLTGSLRPAGQRWQASLPRARGSQQRVTRTFDSRDAAQAWLQQAVAELNKTGGLQASAPRVNHSRRHKFETVGQRWADEYYIELNRGDADREMTVRRHIRRIEAFMTPRALTLETMSREHVKALQAHLVSPQQHDRGPDAVPHGVDPLARVTLAQATALPAMASRSTLKRRLAAGLLAPVGRVGGADVFAVTDLYRAAGGHGGPLRRGPKTRGGALTVPVANDVMWVFEQVCRYAADHGVTVPDDRSSLKMHRPPRQAPDVRAPVELAVCARVAGRLHAVHQMTMWMTRILGLRIGEAYGPLVRDVVSLGPGEGAAITIAAQGGRTFRSRDAEGAMVTSTGSAMLKNEQSYRVLVAPPMLAELIQVVIATFHTGPDGVVREGARLIPGLRSADAGGQSSFRTALLGAARAEGVRVKGDVADLFGLTPHDMRRALLSDLDRTGMHRHRVRRVAGHLSDGSVLARHYLLDDPALQPARQAATMVQAELEQLLPAGLLVPTTARCTTGAQRALASRAAQIDTELIERGWLLPLSATRGSEGLMLEPAAAAARNGVATTTVRRWAREGAVGVLKRADSAGRARTLVCDADVAARARVTTLADVATDLGVPYDQLYRWVRSAGLHTTGARVGQLSDQGIAAARAHFEGQQALWLRAMPLAQAVGELGMQRAAVLAAVVAGELVEDLRSADGRRMLTRESVERLAACARPRPQRCLSVQQAARTLGMPARGVHDLLRAGALTPGPGRQVSVTAASLVQYASTECPERLLGLPV